MSAAAHPLAAGSGRKLSARLRAGGVAFTALAALLVVAPFFAAEPDEILDPAAASLLPPFSSRTVLRLRDGSTLVGRALEQAGEHVLLERRGRTTAVPAASLVASEQRLFVLGTDTLGRDVLARTLHGGRVSLVVGLLALAVALVLGVGVGLLAGSLGGFVDAALMRVVDVLLAVPMLFALILLAALFRPSLPTLVAVLGFSAWMGVARLVRGQVLSLRERDFVLAARGIGASEMRIALIHVLPNLATPLAQDAALRLGDLVLVEAALSFLGLGVQPPLASWGGMVAEGEEVLLDAWWLTFVPGLGIVLAVVAAALLADGLGELARAEES